MLTTLAICSVSEFKKEGHTHDKNGNANVFLSPLSGEIPNKCMVLAGSVAINNGIELGKSYLFKFTEVEASDEYGRQFNTSVIQAVGAVEIMTLAKTSKAQVINVGEDATVEADAKATAKSEFSK